MLQHENPSTRDFLRRESRIVLVIHIFSAPCGVIPHHNKRTYRTLNYCQLDCCLLVCTFVCTRQLIHHISTLHCLFPSSHTPFIKFHQFVSLALITYIAPLTLPLFYLLLLLYHLHLILYNVAISHFCSDLPCLAKGCVGLNYLLTLEWTVSYSHLLLLAFRNSRSLVVVYLLCLQAPLVPKLTITSHTMLT